jgi:hypothetical protein
MRRGTADGEGAARLRGIGHSPPAGSRNPYTEVAERGESEKRARFAVIFEKSDREECVFDVRRMSMELNVWNN